MPVTELPMPMTEKDRGCLGPLPHLETLYTIGYSDVPAEEFFAMLAKAGVTLLVDVRQYPSGAYTFYTALRDMPYICKLHGIDHTYVPGLAPSRQLVDWYKPALGRMKRPTLELWGQYKDRYIRELVERRVMFGPEETGQTSLLQEPGEPDLSLTFNMLRSGHKNVAFMCIEQHPDDCHRSLAANMIAFLHTGLTVRNLVTTKIAKRWKIKHGGAYCVV